MPRKARISREAVVVAALEEVDAQGIAGLSMRGVAARLGVKAMALYGHVRHKEDLLGALLQTLMERVRLPSSSPSWRGDVEAGILSFYSTFSAHPAVLPLFFSHAAHGTSAARSFSTWLDERLSEPVPQAMDRVYAHQVLYGYALGQTAAQGLLPEAALLGEQFGAASHELTFELGLRALLDGVERRNPF